MIRGVEDVKDKKKPWKTKVERDSIMHKDLKESSLQGGKVIGNLALRRRCNCGIHQTG